MRRRRLLWQLYPSYLLITLFSLLAVTAYFTRSLRSFYENETVSNLEARARLLEHEVDERLAMDGYGDIDELVKILGTRSQTRITIILPDGKVIADSEKDPETMDNHSHRPEVLTALAEKRGSSSRYSDTIHLKMMYVAVPLIKNGEVEAIVRTSTPISVIDKTMSQIYGRLIIAWLVIGVLAAWVSWVNARRISHPLEEMRMRARRIAGGDLSGRLPIEGSEEVGALAEAMNQMAEQMDDRIRTILRQRREQKAVFASISDGVLAIDADGLLISINRTAANLFGVDRKQVRGHTIQEVISNHDLRYFVVQALRTTDDVEDELYLEDSDRFLHAHGRPLRDEFGKSMGAVVVLNDVTRLRRLEQTRRDFVANVSHELRTPVTSIKGFVETLKDGALDDPDAARRFIDIIARQASRLDAIIEDLLSLARIERDAEREQIHLDEAPLAEIIRHAVIAVEPIAKTKDIHIQIHCVDSLSAFVNPPLLEQAIVNLVENAIKYSGEGTPVEVTAVQSDGEIQIRVTDRGAGIAAEHLPRLFERFYRVDKGRSREVGGTGLGLAIVKHIMIAHGGHVDVDSTPGEGSIFTLHIPENQEQAHQLSLLQEV